MLLLLKFAKILSVAALFAGTIGAMLPRDLHDRRRFAYWLAGPAMGSTWASGFGLGWTQGTSLLNAWVVGAIALSLFSLQIVLFAVGREGRRGGTVASLAIVPLVLSIALMVWKPVISAD